jgi:hypothetical protein
MPFPYVAAWGGAGATRQASGGGGAAQEATNPEQVRMNGSVGERTSRPSHRDVLL